MASRRKTSSRRSSGGRSSSSSNNGSLPVMLIMGATVLIIVLVVMSSSSSDEGDDTSGGTTQQQPAQPKPQPKSTPSNLAKGAAVAGKTPDRPAPALTMEMLNQANVMYSDAKALNNEGVKLRTAGKNQEARQKQSEAAVKLESLKKMIEVPSDWQAEADMEDWAQPAEYATLAKLYGKISNLEKRVRMGGGTR